MSVDMLQPVQDNIVKYEVKMIAYIDPRDSRHLLINYSQIKRVDTDLLVDSIANIYIYQRPSSISPGSYEVLTPENKVKISPDGEPDVSQTLYVIVSFDKITRQYSAALDETRIPPEISAAFVNAVRDFLPTVKTFLYTVDINGTPKTEDTTEFRGLLDKYNVRLSAPAQAAGGLHKIRKLDEKVVVGGRERVVYKAGNKKFVKVKGDYVSLTEFRKATEAAAKLKQKAAKK